jgi:hypothetical protein
MTKSAALFVALVAAYDIPYAVAHDTGNETVVLTGTIKAIDSNRIQIETRDTGSLQRVPVWVITTRDTRYKRGKTRVEAEAVRLTTDERIVVVASSEPTRDDSLRFVALQIELSDVRRRCIEVSTAKGQVRSIVITENCRR